MSMLGTLKYRLLPPGYARASKQTPPSSWAAPQWLAHHTHHENALNDGMVCLTSLEQFCTLFPSVKEQTSVDRAI